MNWTEESADAPIPLPGTALFGGDRGAPVFGPPPDLSQERAAAWPDISQPGPDMGDFPNSSYTLPKGRVYVEFAPATFVTADAQNPAAWVAPYLLRYGLTDNVEFRIFGNGLTRVGGSSPSFGFSPLNFDMKVHLWNDRREWFIPASSLEVYILTTMGSSQFNAGIEPSINMNFDLPITKRTNLEWTVGYSGVQQAVNIITGEVFVPRFGFLVPGLHRQFNVNFNQFSAQWAIEHDVTDKWQVFVHGFHNGALHFNLGAGEMIGAGLFWKCSRGLTWFGSANHGLTRNLPPFAGQIGLAVAL